MSLSDMSAVLSVSLFSSLTSSGTCFVRLAQTCLSSKLDAEVQVRQALGNMQGEQEKRKSEESSFVQLREDPDGVLRAMRERESSREAHGPHLAFPGGQRGGGLLWRYAPK